MSSKDHEKNNFNWLWNAQTKELFGRNGTSWLKIIVFYIIFYICLAAFWALMLMLFYQTIDPNYPKWQLDSSRIGTSPGLGYRPRPPNDKIDSTLISFSASGETDATSWKHWVDNLNEFINPYQKDSNDTVGRGQYIASASDCEANKSPGPDKFCPFDVKTVLLGECNPANSFGYKFGRPCILIKLNKIYNWVPKPLTQVPADLGVSQEEASKGVVIECHGENSNDKEKIGPLKYHPSQVIRSAYFPYTNQPGYLSPFVMVQFEKPARGILINVECRAYADNIKYDRADRDGSVHFELLLD